MVAAGAKKKEVAEGHKYSSSRRGGGKVAEGHKYSSRKRERAASIRAGAGRPHTLVA